MVLQVVHLVTTELDVAEEELSVGYIVSCILYSSFRFVIRERRLSVVTFQ